MQPLSIVDDSEALPCALALSDLRLEVRLGCGAAERAKTQGVRFDLSIRFDRLPAGTKTDRLDGTVCYAEISEKLRALCAEREFHLIENLGYEAYKRVHPGAPLKLWLKVTKLKPPVTNLEGGASFELGEK
jgi:FolB domain-containing protein